MNSSDTTTTGTVKVRNRRYTTAAGASVTVWCERQVERSSVTGWSGCTRTVRTWCEVTTGDQAGTTVEVETGASYKAESACREAGVR